MIEVPDLDTALDWAAKYPAGPDGVVEVRPNISAPAGERHTPLGDTRLLGWRKQGE